MKRNALGVDAFIYPEKYGIAFAYKGKEKIEEKDYLVLEQTFSGGYKAILYIDPKTYLTYKTKSTAMNQMGVEVEQETFESDFKKVNGMIIAYSIIIFQDGEEFMTLTFTDVSLNSGLEDSLFKMSE
jgi:outer membrane lipoprotein-sorting protein